MSDNETIRVTLVQWGSMRKFREASEAIVLHFCSSSRQPLPYTEAKTRQLLPQQYKMGMAQFGLRIRSSDAKRTGSFNAAGKIRMELELRQQVGLPTV